MTEERKPKTSLAKKQYELETKKTKDGKLPPWLNKQNENTRRDLRRFNVEQYQDAIEAALQTGKHSKELLALKELADNLALAHNYIANATIKKAKYRERVEHLYFELETAISALENSTGFDLLKKETW